MPKKPPKSPASEPRSFTDTKRIRELVALMNENGLSEIELAEDDARIVLRRGTLSPHTHVLHAPAAVVHAPTTHGATPPAAEKSSAEEELTPIRSPMVGTFYSAPTPDAPAYVSVGSHVDEKSVVCIVEAMKHFNEIHAEIRGTIAKVLVSNGQVVEFNQPLFLVKTT